VEISYESGILLPRENRPHLSRFLCFFPPLPLFIDHVRASGRAFLVFLAFWDMGLAAAMGTLGILTVIKNKPDSIDDVTEAFLGIYMAIFAAILCLYELCWMQPLPAINRVFRKNFGFMYGLRSKGMFLVFIAFLTIGLYDETKNSSGIKGLDWATGLGWLATGVYLVLIGFIWPDLLDIYKPPSAGLTTETAQDHANVV
jgi:hypothetical protein